MATVGAAQLQSSNYGFGQPQPTGASVSVPDYNPQFQYSTIPGVDYVQNAFLGASATGPGMPDYVGNSSYGYDPRGIAGQGQTLLDTAGGLAGVIPQLLASGFDPQGAQRDRFMQGVTDRTRLANQQAGLGSTPYGLGLESENLASADLAWGRDQLGRQIGAAGAAGGLLEQVSGATQTGANVQAQPLQYQLQQEQLGQQESNQFLSNWLDYLRLAQQQEQSQAQAYQDYLGNKVDVDATRRNIQAGNPGWTINAFE